MSNKLVFVTGGAGFIGSHCVLSLLEAGYDVVAIDNFANSVADGEKAAALERVEELTGKTITFYHVDLLDRSALEDIFKKHKIDVVIHFAAMKAISESMKEPMLYYENNIMGTINLLSVMRKTGVRNFVFSGSCTVYGSPQFLPLTEDHPTGNVTNVYGRTKYFCEELLKDVARAEQEWNIISLRYFNPVGAHPSGRLGEDPVRAIANIMPFLGQVAAGKMPAFTIFGKDYDTRDGTCVRDYIHIMDLASGHVAAVKKLESDHVHFRFINLGSGNGVTILELIKQFEESCGVKIPYEIRERREGDVGSAYGNIDRAWDELGWKPEKSLDDMCKDFWRWKTMNPTGYKTVPAE
jgi:UDP-glucose 4-epimerase